ncbi:SusC/RagA family TonB-linked outer membrane protein [Elizabethkingia anophelis]|uniref:SusC/RagA family TonB-linked outer membrane protein n=1 Tax=Elizabethkingia anophelis TaxID=1117645 RepID=UPI000C9BCE6F|nr:SusC/RagA family TonB-linked outer membrane protein [Elizabethkingia anophelis]MCL1033781.1 SusC/RagA family TonB-linked outer membrane protein [Elizabethkingia anophelis]MCT3757474.1 SusC/RagA family TonB-linked outer membrane protein [Elizabethkingia anophelis]MCT3972864.1 SusC/RagA family TonB-linked outer membrane protein [Elizabethkingia anophelis]MCT4001338.1 SusC/RagA family TonB-linked outer membrane protein [Elizabethkingia anophelis]MCT4015416.1 SusC/RagA family TonB-linked outer 
MNVKFKVLSAGVLFFIGQSVLAQNTKRDSATSTKSIEEVVIVGFGQKKTVKELTGALSTMNGKAIEDNPVATSVDKMLQGRVAGVQTGVSSGQPGGFASVRVRGISSINGVKDPIYIVDGVRIKSGNLSQGSVNGVANQGNVLANLNPNDIENITVLKDAVSTAMYGADAGSGVIIITTKKGKRGAAKFNMNFTQGITQDAVKRQGVLSADQYKKLLTYSIMNAYQGDPNYGDNFKNYQSSYDFVKGGGLDAEDGGYYSGILNSPYNTNWKKATQRDVAYMRNVEANMSGGNDKMTYFGSVNYFDQNSTVKGADFKRITATTSVAYQATERLKISTDIQMAYSNTNSQPEGGVYTNPLLGQYFNLPTDPLRNPDGSWYLGQNGRLTNGQFNNAAIQDYNYQRNQTSRIFANLQAEYKLAKGLTYKFVFAPEFINLLESAYYSPIHGDGRSSKGQKTDISSRYFNFNLQNILTYNFSADLNNMSFTALQEAYRTQLDLVSATGMVVGSPYLQTMDNFIKPYSVGGQKNIDSRWGYGLVGHYDYDRIILLDASYRRDVLSNFTPGKKAGNFWSVGLGLDVARFDFMKDWKAMSMLKLRASYGKVGNQVLANPYALYSYRGNYNDLASADLRGVYNPNLSWETINPLNIGVDLGFLNNRITLTAEYYNKKSKDLLFQMPLQISQGLPSYWANIGDMVNKGFEFTVNADILKNSDGFNWSVNGNLSTLKNVITNLPGGDIVNPPVGINGASMNGTILRQGESMNSYYMRKWAGVDPTNGDPLWYINGKDGATTNKYAEAKEAIQGTSLNKVTGGFGTNISYKGISLDAFFTYGFGGKILDQWMGYTVSDGSSIGNTPGYESQMDFWTPENPNASNPKPILDLGNKRSFAMSTRRLYKSDYIRLSNIKLAYTFKGDILEKTKLTSLQIYVLGNNVWTHTFDKNLRLDPEISVTGNYNLGIPIQKAYMLGVNIGF